MPTLHTVLSHRKIARALAAGSVALATGGIVLLRAPGSGTAAPHGPSVHVVTPPTSGVQAPRVEFRGPRAHGRVALSQGRVEAGGTRQVYAELRVAADEAPVTSQSARPVAMALVLDVSGSMTGEKIEQARQSVLSMIEQMRDTDQIALVTYSDSARVVQPLATVRDVRSQLRVTVPTIQIEGGTNIPAGLMLGAQALSDAPESLVRRVVLMSDGRDGSGQDLERVASDIRTRAERGVTLSSLGVGSDYDERYMSRLADAGRGNYEFLRDGAQLRAFLGRELQQATRTTVERAVAEVHLPAGWRLTRAYGAEAEGTSGTVRLPIGALALGEERRLVLDLAVDAPSLAAGTTGALTSTITYRAVPDDRDVRVETGGLALALTGSSAQALASRDAVIFGEAESTVIALRQQDAVQAWRDGRVAEARGMTQQNLLRLREIQADAPMPSRAAQIAQFERDDDAIRNISAASESGRAYGLGANARHRSALRNANAY